MCRRGRLSGGKVGEVQGLVRHYYMTATRRQVGVRQKQTIGCLTLGFCKIERRHKRVLLGSIFIVVDDHWQPYWKASFAVSFHFLPCYVERRSFSLKHEIPRWHDSRLFRVVVAAVGSMDTLLSLFH